MCRISFVRSEVLDEVGVFERRQLFEIAFLLVKGCFGPRKL